ncbi:MAG: NADPH-dependent glutamate synthase [Bacteroidales bacterium]
MNKDKSYLQELRNLNWREDVRKSIPAKERIAKQRVSMPAQDAKVRSTNSKEVNCGLTSELAIEEAQRCLDCVNPTCIDGCPVNINIPSFIKHIEKSDFLGAAQVLKETSALPAVCGRVCPQEKQCEETCFYTVKLKKEPVAIGHLERFAADYERESGSISVPETAPDNGYKIAIIGSGPAGLSAAGDLAKMGCQVTVFEALHEIGGVLKYGIPEFRLPNSVVDVEINNLKEMGVRFIKNFVVGSTASIQDLRDEGYDAFFVSSGAGLPNFMGIPGENYAGIMSSNEYLTRVNLMKAAQKDYDTPVYKGKNVIVIGGGNTAMDSVRTAKRLGAERAIIMYRRSMEEMPAREEEIEHAVEEGIEFMCLNNPVKYYANENGHVSTIVAQKMELGEPDASGRRRPIPVKDSEYEIEVDLVVVSVGVSPNPLIPKSIPELEMTRWGTIVVDEETMQAKHVPDVFAGGDIVRGGATVILAMGDGRTAAQGIFNYVKSKK